MPGTSVRSLLVQMFLQPQPFLYLSGQTKQNSTPDRKNDIVAAVTLLFRQWRLSKAWCRRLTICYQIALPPMVIQASSVIAQLPPDRSLICSSAIGQPAKDTTWFAFPLPIPPAAVANDSVRFYGDSVKISVNNTDTTICSFDTVHLPFIRDGKIVPWTPSSPSHRLTLGWFQADAVPITSTHGCLPPPISVPVLQRYHFHVVVSRSQTGCRSDTVCLGAPVYLHATGGAAFTYGLRLLRWIILFSPNPVAHPDRDIIYSVSVYDTLSCPAYHCYCQSHTFRGLLPMRKKILWWWKVNR